MSEVEDQKIETWLDRLSSSKPADMGGDEKDDMRLKIEEYLTERLQPLDRHLPHRHTEDFWLEVVKIDGTKLWAVPDKLKTPEICLAAILQTPCAVSQNIPDDIMTPGFCQKLCDRNDEVFLSLPADKKPYSLCLDVVRRNGEMIRHVPRHLLDEGLCLAAVASKSRSLAWIPDSLRTEKVCRTALRSSWESVRWIPEKYLAPEICFAAVHSDCRLLQYIPEHLRDENICLLALSEADADLLDVWLEVPQALHGKAAFCSEAVTFQPLMTAIVENPGTDINNLAHAAGSNPFYRRLLTNNRFLPKEVIAAALRKADIIFGRPDDEEPIHPHENRP